MLFQSVEPFPVESFAVESFAVESFAILVGFTSKLTLHSFGRIGRVVSKLPSASSNSS